MISTQERIELISEACTRPQVEKWLGKITAEDLRTWLVLELGSEQALDEFQPHGSIRSRANAPGHILHIVSGNTPHAAFQSLLRGLLLGSHNTIKIPSSGLPAFTGSMQCFPARLRELVEIHQSLEEIHWSRADAVIATGSDETIASIHEKIRPDQVFIPHGHKLSIGIVTDDFENAAVLAARDVSLYNQRGCLSVHAIYVRDDAAGFAALLAKAMEHYSRTDPPAPIDTSEAGAIRNLRETTRFCAANDRSTQLWESGNNLDWTVIHEDSPTLKLSCLNRCVYVKPMPDELNTSSLGSESQHLSTIAVHPFKMSDAALFSRLPAHRICPLGASQQPSLFWHHDGFAPLASLVKWTDLG